MVSDRESVGERHGPMKIAGGNGKSEYASSLLCDVLVRGRNLYSSSKDTDSNEEMEFQAVSVGLMHLLNQLSEIPSAKNHCSEEVLSGDTFFTFHVLLITEADVPHMPHTIGYNSIFNYANNHQHEENNSHLLLCQKRQDASTDPVSDSVLRTHLKNLLKTEVGYDRSESSCTESGDNKRPRTWGN